MYHSKGGVDRKTYVKYLGNFPDKPSGRLVRRTHRFAVAYEGWQNLAPNAITYGLFLKFYLDSLRTHHREAGENSGMQRSLLVGASTPYSLGEFDFAVRQLCPGAKLAAIDIEPMEGWRESGAKVDFRTENALQLPSTYHTRFDTIHTNAFVHALRRQSSEPEILGHNIRNMKLIALFLQNAFRSLRPGGSLFMLEFGAYGVPEYMVRFQALLEEVGFTGISLDERVGKFRLRRYLDRFMRDPSDSVPEALVLPGDGVFFGLTARKPVDSPATY